jgi:hypothetical protein
MLKIANKKIRTEPNLIDVENGPPQPAATPRMVKASTNLIIKQKQRVLLEEAIPETRDMLLHYLEVKLAILEKVPTKDNAHVVACAANLVDRMLNEAVSWRLRNESK